MTQLQIVTGVLLILCTVSGLTFLAAFAYEIIVVCRVAHDPLYRVIARYSLAVTFLSGAALVLIIVLAVIYELSEYIGKNI